MARITAIFCLMFLVPALAHGQPQDVGELIKILKKRPSDMNDDMWREKRREAARVLGRLGDKKAVKPLIRVVESERFDAIAEISIDSLGRLGDTSAISVLRKVYNDSSRDRYARDAAETALRRLGANPNGGRMAKGKTSAGVDVDIGDGGGFRAVGGGGSKARSAKAGEFPLPDDDDDLKAPKGPGFPSSVLAAHENLTLAVGSLDLTFNDIDNEPQLLGTMSSRYQRGLEKSGFGYSLDASLGMLGAVNDDDLGTGNNISYVFNLATTATSEARLYFGNAKGAFLHGAGGALLGVRSIKVQDPMGPTFSDLDPLFNLTLGLGPGYGRVLNTGESMRLRRIEQVLKSHGILGRPINAGVARRMFSAWWGLRNELGMRRRLLATLQVLRERGVLLTAPDASVVYKILKILEDGQLAQRPSGFDVRIGAGETFAYVEFNPGADDHEFQRRETAFLRATYARQIAGGATELIATSRFLYGLTGDPGFYTTDTEVIYRRYFYGPAWDAKGALEFGARIGISNFNTDAVDSAASTLLGAHVAYLLVPSRASRMRLSADFRLVTGVMFMGISFGADFGSLDAAAAPW